MEDDAETEAADDIAGREAVAGIAVDIGPRVAKQETDFENCNISKHALHVGNCCRLVDRQLSANFYPWKHFELRYVVFLVL